MRERCGLVLSVLAMLALPALGLNRAIGPLVRDPEYLKRLAMFGFSNSDGARTRSDWTKWCAAGAFSGRRYSRN